MKIKHLNQVRTESTIPTPDEAGERARLALQQHKEKHKGKQGVYIPPRTNPGADEYHRQQDQAERQQRDDRATARDKNVEESGQGGINRAAPATDVSYQDILNTVTDKWKGQTTQVSETIDDQIELAESALKQVQNVTKGIKYDSTALDIISEVQQIAKSAGVDEKELNYAINSIFEIKNSLESAIYGLEEAFEDKLRSLINQKEEDNDSFVTEMTVDKLKDYTQRAKEVDPATTPKYKMVKHAEGHAKANKRIAQKTADRTRMYESVLELFLEDDQVDEACWKDYKQVGMKKKGTKTVPNCVPKK